MTLIMSLAAILASYALGSIPTGLWLGLSLRHIDIREHGSKNIGATNTARVLGKKLGAVALVCDIAKGAIPVVLARYFGSWALLPLFCGLAAVTGHVASLYLRFKGGKGVAAAAGAFAALAPVATLAALVAFGVSFAVTRMASVGSIAAAAVLCASVWTMHYSLPVSVAASAVAAMVVWKHRANIQRIRAGSESRFQ